MSSLEHLFFFSKKRLGGFSIPLAKRLFGSFAFFAVFLLFGGGFCVCVCGGGGDCFFTSSSYDIFIISLIIWHRFFRVCVCVLCFC